jgi:hypothetical protein
VLFEHLVGERENRRRELRAERAVFGFSANSYLVDCTTRKIATFLPWTPFWKPATRLMFASRRGESGTPAAVVGGGERRCRRGTECDEVAALVRVLALGSARTPSLVRQLPR